MPLSRKKYLNMTINTICDDFGDFGTEERRCIDARKALQITNLHTTREFCGTCPSSVHRPLDTSNDERESASHLKKVAGRIEAANRSRAAEEHCGAVKGS
jgi:hypothetical protein